MTSAESVRLLASMPRLQHLALRRLEPDADVYIERPCRWETLVLAELPQPVQLLRLPLGSVTTLCCRWDQGFRGS